MPGQYPFADANQAFGGVGNHLSQIAAGLAMKKYQQDLLLQRIAQAAQAEADRKQNYLAVQKQHDEQMGYMKPYYEAQTKFHTSQAGAETAKAAIEQARLEAANQAGSAYGQEQVPFVNPLEAGQGPTRAGAQFMSDQANKRQLLAQMLRGLMLASSPNPQRAPEFQVQQRALDTQSPLSPALAAAILTKTHSAIPIGHQGSVYDVGTGGMTTTPQLVPPGNALVPGTGGPPMAMTPNRPVNPGNPLGSVQSLIGHYTAGGYPSNPNDPTYQAATNAANALLKPIYTNPQQPASQGVAQPKSQAEYDALPPGSIYIDSDGSTKRKK